MRTIITIAGIACFLASLIATIFFMVKFEFLEATIFFFLFIYFGIFFEPPKK